MKKISFKLISRKEAYQWMEWQAENYSLCYAPVELHKFQFLSSSTKFVAAVFNGGIFGRSKITGLLSIESTSEAEEIGGSGIFYLDQDFFIYAHQECDEKQTKVGMLAEAIKVSKKPRIDVTFSSSRELYEALDEKSKERVIIYDHSVVVSIWPSL